MKTFDLCWKYTGNRTLTAEKIDAANLPAALRTAAQTKGFVIAGSYLVKSGRRRIRFFGRHGEGVVYNNGYIAAPMIEGFISLH